MVPVQCLPNVIEFLKNLRPNARTDSFIMSKSLHCKTKTAYNPDLALCDLALFSRVKMKMRVKQFYSDEDLPRAWNKK